MNHYFYVKSVKIIYDIAKKSYSAAVWWNYRDRTLVRDVKDYRKLRLKLLQNFDIRIPNKDKLVFHSGCWYNSKIDHKLAI